jgi:hypothetical protein
MQSYPLVDWAWNESRGDAFSFWGICVNTDEKRNHKGRK